MKPVILIAMFYAAQLTPTGDERLDRIRSKMSENLERLPNYTCLMAVDRWSQRSRTPMQHDDTLHLEVAEVGHNELVGWPGSKLGEQKMEDMVIGGLVASGDFSSVAKIVFRSKDPTFEFLGNKNIRGRAALQYRFHVDQSVSNYEVTRGELRKAVVGYSGSIAVDAESLELERLEIVLEKIPKEIGITSAVTAIDYQTVHIGGGDFLLPAKVERNVKASDGSHSKNITTLSECRKYGAESAIRFDDPDAAAEPAARAKPMVSTQMLLPGGMHVPLRLETRLDARKSATGDVLVARTTSDITVNGVTIPPGSEIIGRIRDLRRIGQGKVALQMDFWEIHCGETTVHMMASLEQAEQRRGVEHQRGSLLIDEKRMDISGLLLTYRTRGPGAGYTRVLP